MTKKKWQDPPQNKRFLERQQRLVNRTPRNSRHGFMHKQFHNKQGRESSHEISVGWANKISGFFARLKGETIKEVDSKKPLGASQ